MAKLDYYTGLTFKIYVREAGTKVGSGGRYDGLTASFGKAEPAVGFVLDVDALTDLTAAREKDHPDQAQPQVSHLIDTNVSTLFLDALTRRSRGERISLHVLR